MGALMTSIPAPSQLRAARSGRGLALIGDAEDGGLMLRALAPVSSSGLNLDPRILQLRRTVIIRNCNSAASASSAFTP